QSGQATSYLIDAAEMAAAAGNIPGQYYYGIHVDSQLISSDQSEEFLDGGNHHPRFPLLLQAITTQDDGNPGAFVNSEPSAFNFSAMTPGRVFTMAGVQYLYLENMGSGNHMIIQNNRIVNAAPVEQNVIFSDWYDNLSPEVQGMVQPVANTFVTGNVADGDVDWGSAYRWLPTNLATFSESAADVTQVDTSGAPQPFSLSLADVVRLSGANLAFPTEWSRRTPDPLGGSIGMGTNAWALRTQGETSSQTWVVGSGGQLHGLSSPTSTDLALRPALIINQAP
ncbi:hypothetical protein AALA58_07545, partial [Lactococcus ileimucosae]